MIEFVNSGLSRGAAVELADLGMLKVTVGSQQVEKPEQVSSAILKNPRIQFFPKHSMRDAAGKVRMKVVNQYTRTETEENEEEETP